MRSLITAVLLGGWAASLGAQSAATIDSGMTRDQVVAKLGEPLSTRTYDSHTYLMYKNGCEKTCGMNDLVILDSGKVVDAVFRSSSRHYSGTSSSPRMISMNEAQHGTASGALAMPAGEPKASSPRKPKAPDMAKKDAAPAASNTATAPAKKTAPPKKPEPATKPPTPKG